MTTSKSIKREWLEAAARNHPAAAGFPNHLVEAMVGVTLDLLERWDEEMSAPVVQHPQWDTGWWQTPRYDFSINSDGTLTAEDLGLSIEGMDDDRSEEHTSEIQSLMRTSYAVFCLQ